MQEVNLYFRGRDPLSQIKNGHINNYEEYESGDESNSSSEDEQINIPPAALISDRSHTKDNYLSIIQNKNMNHIKNEKRKKHKSDFFSINNKPDLYLASQRIDKIYPTIIHNDLVTELFPRLK